MIVQNHQQCTQLILRGGPQITAGNKIYGKSSLSVLGPKLYNKTLEELSFCGTFQSSSEIVDCCTGTLFCSPGYKLEGVMLLNNDEQWFIVIIFYLLLIEWSIQQVNLMLLC